MYKKGGGGRKRKKKRRGRRRRRKKEEEEEEEEKRGWGMFVLFVIGVWGKTEASGKQNVNFVYVHIMIYILLVDDMDIVLIEHCRQE